ncbi:uncharacterized protein LOC131383173 [Hylobates moloch]|uniref:uncharacterized protein LOC131383173 n=1 Tax=Hylobates moloch TaxID=81572 RepID=UPI00267487AA|nr:uncharacterized protein LOC131383173 [Hylobates moloch]
MVVSLTKASPSSSSLNIFSCAPLGITHLNSSSTPSGAACRRALPGSRDLGSGQNSGSDGGPRTPGPSRAVYTLLCRQRLGAPGTWWKGGYRSLCPSISSLPPVTLSRSAVHVAILFRQLNEPTGPSRAPKGQYFLISSSRKGDGGGETEVCAGLGSGRGRCEVERKAEMRRGCTRPPAPHSPAPAFRGDVAGVCHVREPGAQEGRAGRLAGVGNAARPPDAI